MTKREWLLKHGYKADSMVGSVYTRPLPNCDMSVGIALWEKQKLDPLAFAKFDYKSIITITRSDYEKIGRALNQAELELKQMIKECK